MALFPIAGGATVVESDDWDGEGSSRIRSRFAGWIWARLTIQIELEEATRCEITK